MKVVEVVETATSGIDKGHPCKVIIEYTTGSLWWKKTVRETLFKSPLDPFWKNSGGFNSPWDAMVDRLLWLDTYSREFGNP